MARRSTTSDVNGRDHEELIAPVTILDARGRVVAVLPVAEFRRIHGMPAARRARRVSREETAAAGHGTSGATRRSYQ